MTNKHEMELGIRLGKLEVEARAMRDYLDCASTLSMKIAQELEKMSDDHANYLETKKKD